MRRALAFGATWPSLESLSLSAWDSFPDAVRGRGWPTRTIGWHNINASANVASLR
jgi:hypothetical protein